MAPTETVGAGKLLRRVARGLVRKNAFIDLRAYDRAMPGGAFGTILAVLVALRIYSIVCMVIAWQGWMLDPGTWATGQPIEGPMATPFHDHPHPFGGVFQIFVILHNVTGAALFLVCLVPLLVRKGGKAHVWFGRAFVLLWLFHLVDGLSNSGQILAARGFEPTRYYEVTGQGFSLYLYIQFAFISSMVIDFLAHALAAIHYKNQPPSAPIRALMLFLPITSLGFGVGIALWGAMRLASGVPPETANTIPFAIVFVVQVPAYIYLIARNIQYWLTPSPRAWLHGWIMEHQRNMMFCVQVTLYTGLANAADRLAPILTPFLFGLIDVGFIVWILTKERAMRRRVVASRLGLALVSSLRGGPRRPVIELNQHDEAWIRDVFDLDESGAIELGDVQALLQRQGVEPTVEELKILRDRLDHNGDGKIDRGELATFLAVWFASYPSNEDELSLAFRALDEDGDGRITPDELRSALATGDDGLVDAEIEHIMRATDLDRSGAIEWEEFVDAVRRRPDAGDGEEPYLARETRVG